MAERVVKDVGMMQKTEVKYRLNDPADRDGLVKAWQAFGESLPIAQPGDWMGDALRRENADRCRAILATVGLSDDGKCAVNTGPLREKGLAENSAQWIAAFWLASYHRLMAARKRFESGDTVADNIGLMLFASEEMGRLQERMWWRAGVDPVSGEKREVLALTGRPVKRGQKDGAAITNKAHAPIREARFTRMKELVPDLGVENAARHCEAEGLGGWQAIRRQWDRFKEKPDTRAAVRADL